MNKKILVTIAVIIIVGAGSFYSGMIYGKSQAATGFNSQNFRSGQLGNRGGNGAGAGFLSGNIIAKDDKSITISLRSGGSKIIFYSGSTEISKFVSGTPQDLQIGQSVTVTGTANSDGSESAATIQSRPAPAKQ